MVTAPYYAPTYFPAAYFYVLGGPEATSPDGLTPYNAPTYFPAAYFYGSAGAPLAVPLSGPSPYNAPAYFAPDYFVGGAQPPSPVSPSTPAQPDGLDGDSYRALIDLLVGTGAFDAVIFGEPTRRGGAGSGHYPLAVVIPRGWDEIDDYDPAMILRRVFFSILIVIRAEDECRPFDRLDRLTATVRAVVDRSNLRSTSLPGLTRISSGKYQGEGHYPEWSVDLQGEFTSIVDPAVIPAASA